MTTIVTVNWQGPQRHGTLEDVFIQARDSYGDHTITRYLRLVDKKNKDVQELVERLMAHCVRTLHLLAEVQGVGTLRRVLIDRDKYVFTYAEDETYVA